MNIYIRTSKAEYSLLMDWLKERRNRIADDVDFSEGADMMPMYELTEDLQTKLVLGLESAE